MKLGLDAEKEPTLTFNLLINVLLLVGGLYPSFLFLYGKAVVAYAKKPSIFFFKTTKITFPDISHTQNFSFSTGRSFLPSSQLAKSVIPHTQTELSAYSHGVVFPPLCQLHCQDLYLNGAHTR